MDTPEEMNAATWDTGRFHVLDETRNWPLCGGNKIRKLIAILDGMRPKGILTYGSVYSSHCLAAAYWGATHHVPVRLIILSDQTAMAGSFPHIKMSAQLGADIVTVAVAEASRCIEEQREAFAEYVWIPGGGHALPAMDAYRAWFGKQLDGDPALCRREWVILPFGTGTTALGVWSAIRDRGLSMQVIGVSVSRTRERCLKAADELMPAKPLEGMIIDDRFAGQYGRIESYQEALRRTFLEHTGIWPDPIYNVRVAEVLESETMRNGIVIHTGGQWNNLIS